MTQVASGPSGDVVDLERITLSRGRHRTPAEGVCAMEAASLVAGEPFSDHPDSVSPVLQAFLRSWNDGLGDRPRQALCRYVPELVGTAGKPGPHLSNRLAVESARAWLALAWLVRVQAPTWLRLAGLNQQAITLQALPMAAGVELDVISPPIHAAAEAATARTATIGGGDGNRIAAVDLLRASAGRAAADTAHRYALPILSDVAWTACHEACTYTLTAGGNLCPVLGRLQASAHCLVRSMIECTGV